MVVSQNCYRHRPTHKALVDSTRICPVLQGVVKDAITQRADTGHSQAIIVRYVTNRDPYTEPWWIDPVLQGVVKKMSPHMLR